MFVKCIKQYQDLKLNKLINIGEIYEVDEVRAKVLFSAAVAEPTTPEVVVETADKKPVVKRRTTKKKEG